MKLERYISPEYLATQKELHQNPRGYGGRGNKWAGVVRRLVAEYNCVTALDYGCGEGTLREAVCNEVQMTEYDPAIYGKDSIEKYAQFDLVICTDVLEHIEPDRLAVVIEHLRDLTRNLLFLVIATRPSNKFFPNGRNVHLIIEPPSWWKDRIEHPSFEFLPPPKSPDVKPAREYVALLRRTES